MSSFEKQTKTKAVLTDTDDSGGQKTTCVSISPFSIKNMLEVG